MNINLSDLSVLVTRPSPAGEILCACIESSGGHAIHLPTIEFAPPEDEALFRQTINVLGDQDWLIFISPQAVSASVVALRTVWPHMASNVKFAAVGAGTARALQQAGYRVDAYPTNEWSSEGLLNLPEFQDVTGKKIAIIRGEGGRELMGNTLTARDAIVTHVIAYRRVLPAIPQTVINNYINMLKQHLIDVIVCTSFDGVRNLKTLFGESGWADLQQVPLIVMSERIIMLARDLGFQRLWAVPNASLEAILALLAQKKDELCRLKQTK